MNLRIDDQQIIPLRWRLRCDLPRLPIDSSYATDSEAIWAFSDDERDAIAAALDKLKLPYTITAVDQPDPAHLALLQGKVRSREAAFAALAALAAGETPAIPELRLEELEQKVKALEVKPKA